MIEIIWKKIIENKGKKFMQIRGNEFTYEVKGNSIYLSRTNRSISKKTFEEALNFVPLQNTTKIQHLQAPSYLYAILMDSRINNGLW